jgi:hypothetical protein
MKEIITVLSQEQNYLYKEPRHIMSREMKSSKTMCASSAIVVYGGVDKTLHAFPDQR